MRYKCSISNYGIPNIHSTKNYSSLSLTPKHRRNPRSDQMEKENKKEV